MWKSFWYRTALSDYRFRVLRDVCPVSSFPGLPIWRRCVVYLPVAIHLFHHRWILSVLSESLFLLHRTGWQTVLHRLLREHKPFVSPLLPQRWRVFLLSWFQQNPLHSFPLFLWVAIGSCKPLPVLFLPDLYPICYLRQSIVYSENYVSRSFPD